MSYKPELCAGRRSLVEGPQRSSGVTNRLLLHPSGYPVIIDVSQSSCEGAGVAMSFELPVRGHNFPLRHSREHKLITCLSGCLVVTAGHTRVAELRAGEAVVIPPGLGHRVRQVGSSAAEVGVVLWPGQIELAFIELADFLAMGCRPERDEVQGLFERFGVTWDDGSSNEHPATALPVHPLEIALKAVPELLSDRVMSSWGLDARRPKR